MCYKITFLSLSLNPVIMMFYAVLVMQDKNLGNRIDCLPYLKIKFCDL